MKSHAEQDLSSIADVAFLLLIFFIVTSSFALNEGIFFQLPSASAGTTRVDKDELFEITPEESGFLVAGELCDNRRLDELLKLKLKEKPKVIAVIYMNPDIRYERLVDALSLVKTNGVTKVSVKNTN